MAVDYQIGAVLAAVRRCYTESPPRKELIEMNVLILRGLGMERKAALKLAADAARIVDEVGPEKLPWWRNVR
jgi:hypothetical protein